MKKNIAVSLGTKDDFPNKIRYSYYDVKDFKDLKIPKEDYSFAFLSYSDFSEDGKDITVNFHSYVYLVGYLENARCALKDMSSYDLTNPKSFVAECVLNGDGKMLVFEGKDGKKNVLKNTQFVRAFTSSDELLKGVQEFIDSALTKEEPKTYCKCDVK